MKKKIVTTILAVAMAASLAACGSSSGAAGESANAAETSNAVEESANAVKESASVAASSDSTAAAKTSATADGITEDEFNQIEDGMSYDQVKEIIGEEGTESSTSQVGDITTTIYTWSSDGFGTANVTFQNDQVVNKAQAGVSSSDVTVTMDQYDQVETGMSYDEVKEIMGGDGTVMSDTTIGDQHDTIYSWSGSSLGANCTINFTNDAVTSKSQVGLDQ